ncbi:uncharacterized protein A4U43_C04F7080 [Asparagus officinalis]|uniref:PX domain-containing protein n=1 Tax=Asparagus officinalis TaxID=4686 RepID=A0A5P1F0Q3_ASPOF|nr:uncharacterized protein A4U43_C04F7080 [Asparagus officinalis]
MVEDAEKVLDEMGHLGFKPSGFEYRVVIQGYGWLGSFKEMRRVIGRMKDVEIEIFTVCVNLVISCYVSMVKDLRTLPLSMDDLLEMLNDEDALLVKELAGASVLLEKSTWSDSEGKLDLHGFHLASAYNILLQWMEEFRRRALDLRLPFLSVTVTDPVKLGNGVQAYTSYRVISKTNLPEYQGQEKIVIRRYSDFVWLHDRLAEKYKGIFIPPLPEKSAVEKFRFSAEFIEMRRQALDIFVNRIASHPELKQSEDLRIFLQEDEETMERARSQEAGLFKKKHSDFMQIFKDVQSKVSDVVLGKEKPIEESNPEYEKLKNYIFELEIHLSEAQKQAFRLVKRHRELGQSLSDFGKAIKLLGSSDGNSLGKVISEFGSKSESLSLKLYKEKVNCNSIENHELQICSSNWKSTSDNNPTPVFFSVPVTEIPGFPVMTLSDKLMLIQSEKAAEAEIEYKELKSESVEATQKYETIVKLMSEEIVRFQEQKTADMGLAFHEFSKGQERLKDVANAWRSLLPKLETCSPSS